MYSLVYFVWLYFTAIIDGECQTAHWEIKKTSQDEALATVMEYVSQSSNRILICHDGDGNLIQVINRYSASVGASRRGYFELNILTNPKSE